MTVSKAAKTKSKPRGGKAAKKKAAPKKKAAKKKAAAPKKKVTKKSAVTIQRGRIQKMPAVDDSGFVTFTSESMMCREYSLANLTLKSWIKDGMPINDDGTFTAHRVRDWYILNRLPSRKGYIDQLVQNLKPGTRKALLTRLVEVTEGEDGNEFESQQELKRQRLKQQILESQLRLEEKKGELIPRDHMERLLEALAAEQRNTGELAFKHFGPDCQRLINEGLERMETEINKSGFFDARD